MNYEHGRTVERALMDMADYLVGRDPRRIEDHWQALFRSSYSRQMPILLAALSGLDMACLDILGKSLDAPVWRLLGGPVRDRIRVYSSVGGPSPEQYSANARAVVAKGFTAVKMTPFPDPVRYIDTPAVVDDIVSRVSAVREAVGARVDVAIDFHRAVSPAMARILVKELEPLRPMFVEEPTHPENVDALLEIARSTSIPIATGERNTTRWGFREICEKKAAAVLQPDVRHCGGILEMRRIAAYAEVHYLAVAPHSAADAVGVAASLQAHGRHPQLPDPGVRRRHRRGPVHRAPALRERVRGPARGPRTRESRSIRRAWRPTASPTGRCGRCAARPRTAPSRTSDRHPGGTPHRRSLSFQGGDCQAPSHCQRHPAPS